MIEVPAGVVDENETAAESAIRELKEETGYIGTLSEDDYWKTSPVMFNGRAILATVELAKMNPARSDPGFCNTNLNMVHVNVDMSLPENQNLKPELEENEFIETFSMPIRELYTACKRFEQDGYAIDARVGTLAEGIELAKRWKLFG